MKETDPVFLVPKVKLPEEVELWDILKNYFHFLLFVFSLIFVFYLFYLNSFNSLMPRISFPTLQFIQSSNNYS